MVKDFLQGKWLKHPLHPILIHVPTALWPSALLFDILANLGGGNPLVQTAFFALLFGTLAALVAIPAGLADWSDIKRDRPAWRIGLYHMGLNVGATLLSAASVLLRWGTFYTDSSVAVLPLALSAVVTLILFVSGYLGGKMVYSYGIGIGRNSKGMWRRIAERGGARLPKKESAS